MRSAALAGVALSFALGCALGVSVEYESLAAELPARRAADDVPILFWAGAPPEPYRELGILRAEGRAPLGLLEYRLRRAARERYADGLIRVQLSERADDPLPPLFSWLEREPLRRLEGTAVLFTGQAPLGHADRGFEAGGGP